MRPLKDDSSPNGQTFAICACLALGGGARYAAGYAVPTYLPYYFEIEYPSQSALFSTANAVAIFACGSTSALAGGALAQMVARHRSQKYNQSPSVAGYATIPILSCLLGGIFTVILFSQSAQKSFAAAIAALFAMQFTGEAWLAGIVAAFRSVPRLGPYLDAALGFFYTTATMLGCLNLLFLGQAVDHVDSSYRLRTTMAAAIAIPYFLAAIFFSIAARLSLTYDTTADNPSFFDWSSFASDRYLSYSSSSSPSYPPLNSSTYRNQQPGNSTNTKFVPFLPPKGDPPLIDGYPATDDAPRPTDKTPLLASASTSNIGFFPSADRDEDDNDNPNFRARSSFLLSSPGGVATSNPFRDNNYYAQ